jgi:hypothetical protein
MSARMELLRRICFSASSQMRRREKENRKGYASLWSMSKKK